MESRYQQPPEVKGSGSGFRPSQQGETTLQCPVIRRARVSQCGIHDEVRRSPRNRAGPGSLCVTQCQLNVESVPKRQKGPKLCSQPKPKALPQMLIVVVRKGAAVVGAQGSR